jgi:hypothetical protein
LEKIQVIEKLFLQILEYSFLVPVLICILIFNKTKFKDVLFVIFIYCFSIFLLNVYWAYLHIRFNRYYNFIYTFIEYSAFTYLLFINIKSKKIKSSIILVSFLFIVFLLFFNLYNEDKRIDSIAIGAETLILLIISIYFFYEQFKNPFSIYLYNYYCFWFTAGILIYLCGSFFFNIYAEHMTTHEKEQTWFFTYIFEIIKNILFSIALIFYFRQSSVKKLSKKEDIPYLDIEL